MIPSISSWGKESRSGSVHVENKSPNRKGNISRLTRCLSEILQYAPDRLRDSTKLILERNQPIFFICLLSIIDQLQRPESRQCGSQNLRPRATSHSVSQSTTESSTSHHHQTLTDHPSVSISILLFASLDNHCCNWQLFATQFGPF
jgi:hypothetical protein